MTLTAWRAVHPDLRSSHGYRWPFPGNQAAAPLPVGHEFTRGEPCPQFVGDGLCLAKTWAGAASGAIPAITCLLVEYDDADVLCEDKDKIRVSRCRLVDVFDAPALIRDGWCTGANLSWADLSRADLYRADLSRADLSWANLSWANLSRANLSWATADRFTRWPAEVDPATRGVVVR